MNGCRNIENLLALRLHGDRLSPGEEAEVAGHLAGCASCRKVFGEVASLHESLMRLDGKRVEPPAELGHRILDRLPVPSIAAARWRRASVVAGAMAAGVLFTLVVQRFLPGAAPAPSAHPRGDVVASLTVPQGPEAAAAGGTAEEGASRPRGADRLAAAARKGTVKVVREVKIFLYLPEAKQVAVTGDFNNWDPEGVRLRPADRPGLWEGELRLGPGAYSYNFIVDGDVLVPDPSSTGQAPDGYGGTNSILLVKGNPAS